MPPVVCKDLHTPPHAYLTPTTPTPTPPPLLIGRDHLPLILFPYKYGLKTSQSSLTLHHLLKMEPTQCSETSAFNTQTPGKYPEDNLSLLQHGESLKTRKILFGWIDGSRSGGYEFMCNTLYGWPVDSFIEGYEVIFPTRKFIIHCHRD